LSLKTTYTEEQLARMARLIDEYRIRQERRLEERALKLWRRSVAGRAIPRDEPPERIH
jgi:hypothetical protein